MKPSRRRTKHTANNLRTQGNRGGLTRIAQWIESLSQMDPPLDETTGPLHITHILPPLMSQAWIDIEVASFHVFFESLCIKPLYFEGSIQICHRQNQMSRFKEGPPGITNSYWGIYSLEGYLHRGVKLPHIISG